ncbi:MAG: hypothetical protein H0Z34_05835 [Brevibacillus sp.]|nr:hypothetical protein [Brevibacillus sp.]
MFTQLEKCVARSVQEGNQLLYHRTAVSEDGKMFLRTVLVKDKNNGFEIWQSFLRDDQEAVNRVFLNKQEINALKLFLR